MRNPLDPSDKFSFDLPSTDEGGEAERERILGEEQRGQALKEKAAGTSLTESKGFAILREYVENQRQARVSRLLLEPITDKNKDEFNFMRGEVAGLMLAVKFAELIAQGAEATLEVFEELRKRNEGTS